MRADDLIENRALAAEDFNRARRQAGLKAILARLTGASSELLSYGEVLRQLKGQESPRRTLEDIPLDAIVGSTGRYQEFTRGFLPRKYISRNRWVGVKMAMTGLGGVPPIEVYRIGEAYFVLDGNHRVSVARQMGMSTIQAYVTEVKTRVPLSRNVQPEELILAAEQTEFLECTRQKELLPAADLRVTAACQYPVLLEHIDVHRYFMGLEQQREIPYEEAFIHWYDTVYRPLAEMIRGRGLLHDFPGRTEADLYLWLSRHRAALEQALGWEISPDAVASDLNSQFGAGVSATPNLALQRLQHVLTVDEAALGQPPAPDRQPPAARADHVVDDLLIALDGESSGWYALELALRVAARESARLHALHVVAEEDAGADERLAAIKAEFGQRCQDAGVNGKLVIAAGDVPEVVCQRARWVDLVVTSLSRPPSPDEHTRLSPGGRALLRHCPKPLIVVPGPTQIVERALLAYDGSAKADLALYAATYLAGWWDIALCIVTVGKSTPEAEAIQVPAREYLALRQVDAAFVQAQGPIDSTILDTAGTAHSDLIIMGGYGLGPTLRLARGKVLEAVLRMTQLPVLICQ